MSSVVQVSSGALLMLFGLLDVFLTVFYARAGTGIFSRFVCAWEWRLLRRVAKLFGRRAQLFLSLCGPAIVVSLISWWALLLTLGAALIFHPYLGSAMAISSGSTSTDFVSVMYAAANSMSIVGSSGFSPQTSTFRLIFMFNSLVGMSVILPDANLPYADLQRSATAQFSRAASLSVERNDRQQRRDAGSFCASGATGLWIQHLIRFGVLSGPAKRDAPLLPRFALFPI